MGSRTPRRSRAPRFAHKPRPRGGRGPTLADVAIRYDHREEASGVPALLVLGGLDLERAALAVGDYEISDRVIVERKAAADFTASLVDGRLFEQATRLAEACARPILLLEGTPRLRAASLDGALASLIRRGIAVVRTEGPERSAEWLALLHRQEARGPSRRRPAGRKRPERERDRIAEDALASLPGISVVKARELLAEFGSLAALAGAEEAKLRRVAGIGPKIARQLAAIFAHIHSAHRREEP